MYYRNEKNKERSFSRNKGFEFSSGTYVFFLDADDEWEKDYIEDSVKFLKRYDIVYSFPRTFINENSSIIRKSKKNIPKDLGELILGGMVGYPSATAFRREKF
ncbi:MAG TPA: glycosyltransferase [Pyrodictiaceae archaeon]|nr:glycosyltransferase [Pyrodictiaceae archaeon]